MNNESPSTLKDTKPSEIETKLNDFKLKQDITLEHLKSFTPLLEEECVTYPERAKKDVQVFELTEQIDDIIIEIYDKQDKINSIKI